MRLLYSLSECLLSAETIGVLLATLATSAAGSSSFNLFSLVAVVVGLAGVGGVVYAVFRSNLATQTIALLKDNNEALQARVAQLETSEIRKDEVAKQQGMQIETLKDLVTGTTALNLLTAKIDTNQDSLLVLLKKLVAENP